MKTLKVIVIGAGNRGRCYTDYMTDERFEVVAVAEPEKSLRDYIKNKHNISEEMCFDSWEPILEMPKFADIAIIATMDQLHYAPTMKAIEKGYDLLLEKPIAPTYKECVEIANFAKEKGVKILVCHVLRYAPLFRTIKDMINDGKLGRIISIHHCECVGNEHQSHSFVRGNWGNSDRSSCMILQKCCHDMDIMQWLIDKPCTKVQSFGNLTYFKRENAPADAPEYCIDGCPHGDTCYYNAVKLYVENKNLGMREVATKIKEPTDEQVLEAIRTTQYGKCVFKCDNNVVDHQVVNLEFEGGALASFHMSAFSRGWRFIRVMGTDGEVYGDMSNGTIKYFDFKTREHYITDTNVKETAYAHGGGDEGLVDILYKYVAEDYDGDMLSEIGISTANHLIAFAAEKSRVEETIVDIKAFENEIGIK